MSYENTNKDAGPVSTLDIIYDRPLSYTRTAHICFKF